MNPFTMLWGRALMRLENIFYKNSNNIAYDTYIKTLQPEFEQSGIYYLRAMDSMHAEQVSLRFFDVISDALEQELFEQTGSRNTVEIKICTREELDALILKSSSERSEPAVPRRSNSLIPAFTFDSFVVGKSNEFAHAAAQAVAKAPGGAFNPLFIYGGTGLGKTHLMNAIGNYIIDANPSAEVVYITAETFTNEMIESINKQNVNRRSMEQFRNKYRTADLLMIDDIQFIASRSGSQEELFNTFNSLYAAGKQIVISSDKPPSEIAKLEERLMARFVVGMLASIELPDYETRMAILRSKVPALLEYTGSPYIIDDEALHYIASHENTNIRTLEGALKKVVFYANHYFQNGGINSITAEIAEKALRDFFTEPSSHTITPELIMRTVCEYYGITEEDLRSNKRNREIAMPRQIIMYLMREKIDTTLDNIGKLLGGKDHSTVKHGADKIKSTLDSNTRLKNEVTDIVARLTE